MNFIYEANNQWISETGLCANELKFVFRVIPFSVSVESAVDFFFWINLAIVFSEFDHILDHPNVKFRKISTIICGILNSDRWKFSWKFSVNILKYAKREWIPLLRKRKKVNWNINSAVYIFSWIAKSEKKSLNRKEEIQNYVQVNKSPVDISNQNQREKLLPKIDEKLRLWKKKKKIKRQFNDLMWNWIGTSFAIYIVHILIFTQTHTLPASIQVDIFSIRCTPNIKKNKKRKNVEDLEDEDQKERHKKL